MQCVLSFVPGHDFTHSSLCLFDGGDDNIGNDDDGKVDDDNRLRSFSTV